MKSVDELLMMEGYETLTKKERWQLIDQIEQRIDKLQANFLPNVKPSSEVSKRIADQVISLRRKRFQIWFSFNTNAPIRTAA